MAQFEQWSGFNGRLWKEEVNVRDFIQNNYTPYEGDESFLVGPTEATDKLWGELQKLQKEERAKGGVLDMETEVVSGLTAYGPGYINEEMKDLEQVVGLQTDKPLKRAFMPYGGIKMAEQACTTYGYEPSPKLHEIFTKYHKTHNQGVFDIYTPEMKKARHSKIITGLPDTYGRGRIVGDYRRVALYGIDYLIEQKQNDFKSTVSSAISDKNFFISSAISELRTCLVLAVINCANRNTSFLCFFIFLLSTCSPFNLRSFKSSHAFALNGIRQVGLNTGMPSTIICPVFSNS